MVEIMLIVIGFLMIALLSYISQLQNDLRQVHNKLDRIIQHVGLDEIAKINIDPELKELLLEGKKVQAVKKYRMATGVGLKEAKEYIDKLSES